MFHDASIKRVLLIEDNPGDVRIVKEVINNLGIPIELHNVTDGFTAMNFICQKGIYASSRRPDLIIIDLNLPRKDGRHLLKILKSENSLKMIPVVVLTVSAADEDILQCYELHANCYIIKTFEINSFMENLKILFLFWLKVVTLPSYKDLNRV